MRTIITFLAFIATSLTCNAQQSKFYQIGNHRFEVETVQAPGCFGPDLPFDQLYEVIGNVRRKLDLGVRCRGCDLKIVELEHNPNGQVEKLVVRHTEGESTFYLIEGEWLYKNRGQVTVGNNPQGWPTPPYGGY